MTEGIDIFKRARELKASALENVSIMQSTPSSSLSPLHFQDSEDPLLTTLRGEGKSWADTVAQLNQHRLSTGEAPTWTEAAAYSRFILHNSITATPTKEVGFEPCDYAHLRTVGSGNEGTSKAGKKRVKDFQNATELSANIRKPATIEGAEGERVERANAQVKGKGKANAKEKSKGKDEERRKGESEEEFVKMDDGMVEVLMHAVAKVQRNFWVFVADELERESGKFVEPKELEMVFHNV